MQESVMRAQVTSVYRDSDIWARKVKKMKLGQLYAIWLRFKREGKLS